MRKHPHVWIMSDDMYEHLVFDGFEHATIAQVAPELRDRTLTVSGVSKTYAMTGWRIGFAGGPKDLIRAMVNMQGQATAGVSTVGQAAAAAALDGPQDGVARADRRLSAPARHGGGDAERLQRHQLPQARRRVLRVSQRRRLHRQDHARAARKLATDQDVCLALLEEAHVATVHGAAYGMSPYLRVSTATDDAVAGRGLPADRGVLRRAALSANRRSDHAVRPRLRRRRIHRADRACWARVSRHHDRR